jgi:hypothetical protein
MLLFQFAMPDLDVIPTPGTYSVVVMHYLEFHGAMTLEFTPGSNVEQILMQFSKAIHEQPSLHTEYLLHHSCVIGCLTTDEGCAHSCASRRAQADMVASYANGINGVTCDYKREQIKSKYSKKAYTGLTAMQDLSGLLSTIVT